MKKGLLYLSVFLVMAALACKTGVETTKPVGVWEKTQTQSPGILELNENSLFKFIATEEDHTDSHGKYSILNSEITFEDDTCYTAGTYEYKLENNNLSLEIKSDNCETRANVLSGTWKRKSSEGE